MLTQVTVEAQNGGTAVAIWNPTLPVSKTTQTRKAPFLPQVTSTYNATTTTLTVRFPATSQGGKVEIYRNGAKVVSASAAAGATLNYVLRNYGKGNYTVVVSNGKTVVYSGSCNVK
ncbi:MAG: hypothetical protein IKN94_07555 [Salinivirgaceae bacterium]|nr:hypothetical protein [Salinivirgaceae bacterium]